MAVRLTCSSAVSGYPLTKLQYNMVGFKKVLSSKVLKAGVLKVISFDLLSFFLGLQWHLKDDNCRLITYKLFCSGHIVIHFKQFN